MTSKYAVLAVAAALFLPAMAQAEEMKHDHGTTQAAQQESPSSKAFAEASAKMHQDMTGDLTGDADVDFVRGMIPHHQGAIDMARIQLQYGKDPEIRKMAEAIIKAQEAEIAEMKQWLQKHGK